jgi:hypothetical protein
MTSRLHRLHTLDNALILLGIEKEPELKRSILYNLKNIQRLNPHSDNWVGPNCSNRGDNIFMLQHSNF